MKQSLLKLFVTAFVAATTAMGAMAQIPHDYYQSLKGKKGAELKTAIHNLVKEAYVLSYYNRENEMCIFSKRNVHFLYFFRGFPARS